MDFRRRRRVGGTGGGHVHPAGTLDTLAGVAFLEERGRRQIAVVGHSFGGAVAIRTGVASPAVRAVCAMSSQTAGTELVAQLDKPLLLMHGARDEVLPESCSRDIYGRAAEPKENLIYPNCRHGLDDCRDEVDRDLLKWLRDVLPSR